MVILEDHVKGVKVDYIGCYRQEGGGRGEKKLVC